MLFNFLFLNYLGHEYGSTSAESACEVMVLPLSTTSIAFLASTTVIEQPGSDNASKTNGVEWSIHQFTNQPRSKHSFK